MLNGILSTHFREYSSDFFAPHDINKNFIETFSNFYLLSVDQHLPSSTNINYLPYQFEQPHMYCFESRLEVSDEETPHALGSEDGFQYIQHEVPNYNKSRCQIKLYLIRGA